jgi:hypothetical protein
MLEFSGLCWLAQARFTDNAFGQLGDAIYDDEIVNTTTGKICLGLLRIPRFYAAASTAFLRDCGRAKARNSVFG